MKTFFTSLVKIAVVSAVILFTYSASAQSNESLAFNHASFVKSEKSFIQLEWTSKSREVDYFVVEKSTDGKNFQQSSIVFTSEDPSFEDYKFRDKEPGNGVPYVYYRIGAVTDAKEVKYMEPISVRISATNTPSLKISVYPNPVTGSSVITLPEVWKNSDVKLQIFTMEGRIVRTMVIPEARVKVKFIAHNLQKGNYILKAFCNNQTIETQIIRE